MQQNVFDLSFRQWLSRSAGQQERLPYRLRTIQLFSIAVSSTVRVTVEGYAAGISVRAHFESAIRYDDRVLLCFLLPFVAAYFVPDHLLSKCNFY
jgi:hypothetical protein